MILSVGGSEEPGPKSRLISLPGHGLPSNVSSRDSRGVSSGVLFEWCGLGGGTKTMFSFLMFFGQNFRFVLGDLSRCFNCSIPRARFASYHHTRKTLKRTLFVHTSLSMTSLSLSLSLQSKCFSFRFLQYSFFKLST
jgi:hypothetical protein